MIKKPVSSVTLTKFHGKIQRQSGHRDDSEPILIRNGYRLKNMVEQFDAKPAEIRALFSNQRDPARTAELRDRMLTVGLNRTGFRETKLSVKGDPK